MDIRLIDNFPLPIKAQIKRQIISMIENRRLRPGELLPSAKEMGLFLSINRNTVAAAYKELEHEGYVTLVKGSGTYVKSFRRNKDAGRLKAIFDNAFTEARKAGFSTQAITDGFITGLLENNLSAGKSKKVILIDCNYEVLETLDAKLKARIPVETHFMLIQDIQALPGKFEKRAREHDLVLCGMNHMEELRTAVPDFNGLTIGFMIRTDFHIMNQILQLPPGTKVGYCCISQKSSKAFFSSTLFASGTVLKKIHAGISDTHLVKSMLASCQVVYATHYVYDHLKKEFPDANHIHRVELDIDPQNFDYILSMIEKEVPYDGLVS